MKANRVSIFTRVQYAVDWRVRVSGTDYAVLSRHFAEVGYI